MDQELIAYLDERFRESSRQILEGILGVVGALRHETMSRFEQVDEAIRQNKDEIRHTQIMMESMRSDIQGVAEGVLSTNQRIDALRDELKQDIKEVHQRVIVSYTDMNKRVRSLEEWKRRVGKNPVTPTRKKSGKKS